MVCVEALGGVVLEVSLAWVCPMIWAERVRSAGVVGSGERERVSLPPRASIEALR